MIAASHSRGGVQAGWAVAPSGGRSRCQPVAALYTLIATAKLNGLDPRARLAVVLRQITDHPASRLDNLLPWNCTEQAVAKLAA